MRLIDPIEENQFKTNEKPKWVEKSTYKRDTQMQFQSFRFSLSDWQSFASNISGFPPITSTHSLHSPHSSRHSDSSQSEQYANSKHKKKVLQYIGIAAISIQDVQFGNN